MTCYHHKTPVITYAEARITFDEFQAAFAERYLLQSPGDDAGGNLLLSR
jgi:hypothetical protein